MNIEAATNQIRGAVRAYLSRDERGLLRIPFHMQRPIVMFGPPGVGKTAIASQVARELGINFVSYSITHHTRQSALGLPYITHEEFDGREYSVSDYTMSEIIAAVHRARKRSGVDAGILFLDEVNCVSETLAPAMLQFLQYKTFGMHRLPEGWTIVCAGNPPEYNRSAREFDPATLDRLKRIDVEPDLAVWQGYAAAHGVHPAITTFLESKPGSFYRVHADVRGPALVTARGWEDLSRMLQAYEAEGMEVDRDLVGQYLQDEGVAGDFFAYYGLFCKYRDDYKVPRILAGQAGPEVMDRAQAARFDERLAVVGLLQEAVCRHVGSAMEEEDALRLVRGDIVDVRAELSSEGGDAASAMAYRIGRAKGAPQVGGRWKDVVADHAAVQARRLQMLGQVEDAVLAAQGDRGDAYGAAKGAFNQMVADQARQMRTALGEMEHAFAFLDAAFGETSQEALVMVTKLSADPVVVHAVAAYGSPAFLAHNRGLLFGERKLDLLKQVEELEEQ